MERILVIEDHSIQREILVDMLKHSGYEIAGEAKDGAEGFEKYKEFQPDLVILDIMMPDVDGKECMKLIMNYDSQAKVVIYSALDRKKDIDEFMKMGAIDFISKPFKVKQVVEVVKKALSDNNKN